MSRTVIYKKYTIASWPVHDAHTGEWRLNISISWEKGGTPISRPYWMPITYPSETEADVHGITFGQRIVDGKVSGIELETDSEPNQARKQEK
jgi:hypothetical protein